jgi:hypothetical protein
MDDVSDVTGMHGAYYQLFAVDTQLYIPVDRTLEHHLLSGI